MEPKTCKTIILDQGEVLGGGERYMIDFLASLTESEKKAFSVLLLGGQHPEYQKKIGIDFPRQDFLVPSLKGGIAQKLIGGFRIIIAGRKLKKTVEQNNTKVIITNSPRANFIAYMACTLWGMKNIRWNIIFHDLTTQKKLWKPLHIWLRKKMLRKADTIVAVSLLSRNILRPFLRDEDMKKIVLIENGINLETIPQPNQPKTIKRILHIGRISPEKGQRITIQAAAMIKESHPEIQFIIAGPIFAQDNIAKEYYNSCQSLVQEKNLTNVEFIGEIQSPWHEIQKADCILSIMTKPETFGRVAIEGFSLNKLVISSNMTGPGEIMKQYIKESQLENYQKHILIPPSDSLALVKSIEHFLQNTNDMKACTLQGRNFVARNFSFQETKKRLLELLKNV